jgi:hypothetical protein
MSDLKYGSVKEMLSIQLCKKNSIYSCMPIHYYGKSFYTTFHPQCPLVSTRQIKDPIAQIVTCTGLNVEDSLIFNKSAFDNIQKYITVT